MDGIHVTALQGGNSLRVEKVTTQSSLGDMGGYFFCCDSINTTKDAKEIINVNVSNTVMISPPFI